MVTETGSKKFDRRDIARDGNTSEVVPDQPLVRTAIKETGWMAGKVLEESVKLLGSEKAGTGGVDAPCLEANLKERLNETHITECATSSHAKNDGIGAIGSSELHQSGGACPVQVPLVLDEARESAIETFNAKFLTPFLWNRIHIKNCSESFHRHGIKGQLIIVREGLAKKLHEVATALLQEAHRRLDE